MKLSQFSDINKIKSELVESSSYINNVIWRCNKRQRFLFFSHLNMLVTSGTSSELILDITKEYRLHKRWLIRILANLYVTALVCLLKLKIAHLFFDSIELDSSRFYPIIIGGNNRFRFIESSNHHAIVVARNSRTIPFIFNAIRAYTLTPNTISGLIPTLMKLDERVYIERQIKGIAINRLSLSVSDNKIVDSVLANYFRQQSRDSRKLSLETYIRYKIFINNKFLRLKTSPDLLLFSREFLGIAQFFLKDNRYRFVDVALCHGDLNRGNIFFGSDEVSIIDWEFFMYRYIKYDVVVYNNNLRHCTFSEYQKFFRNNSDNNFETILLLLEEVQFRFLNYKRDVSNSRLYLESSLNLIKNRLFGKKSGEF